MGQNAGGKCYRRAWGFPACTSLLGTENSSCSYSPQGDAMRRQSCDIRLLVPVLVWSLQMPEGCSVTQRWWWFNTPAAAVTDRAAQALVRRMGCCDSPLSLSPLCFHAALSTIFHVCISHYLRQGLWGKKWGNNEGIQIEGQTTVWL